MIEAAVAVAAAAVAAAAAAAEGATSKEEPFLFGYEHAEELLDIVVRRVVGRVVGKIVGEVDAVDEEAVARVQAAVLAAATRFAALVGSDAIQVAVPFGMEMGEEASKTPIPGVVAADEMKGVMWGVEQHHYQQD